MEIDLKKFSGHDSDMDVYTFRSEFRKLVEPFAQKCMWDEYLKKNYLTGAAYNLVSKMKDIDEIWNKLFEVYGDTRLILQNKISSLEKFAHLDKLKDDEKIAFTITNLLNTMADLSKLAKDNDLEGELYHGGGVIRVLDLLGKQGLTEFVIELIE